MGTAKKEKPVKPSKHKHKQKEKYATKGEEQQQQQQQQAGKAKKHKKKEQQQQAAWQPQPAAAAAKAGSSSPSSSGEDLVTIPHQGSAQQAKTLGAKAPAAAKTPAIDLSSSSADDSDSDGDIEMQEPTAAAAAANGTAASRRPAAAAGGRKAAKGVKAAARKSLTEVLRDEGLVQCQVVGAQCELDLRGIQNPEHKELWVLKLPDGVSVDSLHGGNIHIPHGGLPDARHLQPPPNPFHDPRADLLTYVQSAVSSQPVGHMSLGPAGAARSHNHQHRELLQAHEFEAMTYSVLAAVPPAAGGSSGSSSSSKSSSQLRLLKVGRFIHLASDTALVDKKRVRQVSNAGADVWAAKDGWDGVLLPRHKPRRRLAGWEVEGELQQQKQWRQRGSNDGSSSGDEEFEEVVFLQPGEEADAPAAAKASDSSDSDSDSEQEGRRRSKQQGLRGVGGLAGELHPRFYSDADSDSDTEAQQQQLQGQDEDRPLPGGMEPPFAADLQQWLLSLPVLGRVQMLQHSTAQLYSTEQWAADRRAWWQQPPQNAYLAPPAAHQQEQLLQQLADMSSNGGSDNRDSSSSGSDSEDDADDVRVTPDKSQGGGDGDINPDDIIVVEELGLVQDDDDDGEPGGSSAVAAAAVRLAGKAAAAAGGDYAADEARKEYPCTLPLAYLVTLPQQVEEALSNLKGVRRRQRMRNAAVLLFTDWREVWMQVDKDFLGDDELWQLVQALPAPLRQQIQVQMDSERLRRVQARKQAAKTLGQQMVVAPPGPRPRYMATDVGYATYQAAGEARVAASTEGSPAADAEDAAVADWLLQQGAGQRVKLLGAAELRGRGLDWDTDAPHLQREGLHVLLPDGRDVHIPAGTDLDWQGELRQAWGFDGRGGV